MSPPLLTVAITGQGVVSADQLNTYEQVCDSLATLRSFAPIQGVQVFVQGFATPGDGGAGPFWWNATATTANYTDDNANTIVPPGAAIGVWLRLGYFVTQTPYLYATPTTGFTLTLPTGVNSLILNPAGTLANGSVIFANAQRDGWVAGISTSQTITALSLSSAAGSINGAITTLAANGTARWQWVAAANTWFKV
jgi:hypothetical protein